MSFTFHWHRMLHYTDDQQMQAYHTSTPSLSYGMAAVISYAQGRRKQLESGEAKHGVISISIQEVLCSYLIVAEGNSGAKGSSC